MSSSKPSWTNGNTAGAHWRSFLHALAALALAAVIIDLARHAWLMAGSSLCLLLAALTFRRSLRFHSARWRHLTWVLFVLAAVLHIARYTMPISE